MKKFQPKSDDQARSSAQKQAAVTSQQATSSKKRETNADSPLLQIPLDAPHPIQANGLTYRGDAKEKTVRFTVGRRTAFFKNSPASHAVYRLDGAVYGLAGDFGGVNMGPDDEVRDPVYTWAGDDLEISENEASSFRSMAQSVASHMTYDLFRNNCYTPVVTALQDLLNRHKPGEGEAPSDKYLALQAFRRSLAKDNHGAGQQTADKMTKKNK